MTETIAKWVMRRYALLYNKFKEKEITFKEIDLCLNKDSRINSLIINELKKAGWLTARKDPEEKRKRIYRLKSPIKIFEEIAVNKIKTEVKHEKIL